MERPCGPHTEQHPQEKTWRTSNVLHKRRGFQAKKRKPWHQKGRSYDPIICADGDVADENCHSRPGGADQPERSNEGRDYLSVKLDEPHSPRRNSTSSTMRTAQPHPSRVAPANGNDPGPPAPRRSTCGGTNSDMRAHAVPPTRTAPTIAKASRQPSDGTPIWASPNVAW